MAFMQAYATLSAKPRIADHRDLRKTAVRSLLERLEQQLLSVDQEFDTEIIDYDCGASQDIASEAGLRGVHNGSEYAGVLCIL